MHLNDNTDAFLSLIFPIQFKALGIYFSGGGIFFFVY